MKIKKRSEEDFRFALNAAVLAILISVLLMLVGQVTYPVGYWSQATQMQK